VISAAEGDSINYMVYSAAISTLWQQQPYKMDAKHALLDSTTIDTQRCALHNPKFSGIIHMPEKY
jgi:hypothetical protein